MEINKNNCRTMLYVLFAWKPLWLTLQEIVSFVSPLPLSMFPLSSPWRTFRVQETKLTASLGASHWVLIVHQHSNLHVLRTYEVDIYLPSNRSLNSTKLWGSLFVLNTMLLPFQVPENTIVVFLCARQSWITSSRLTQKSWQRFPPVTPRIKSLHLRWEKR